MLEETKTKISKSMKGKKHSEETKKKISKALKGRIVSRDTREKIGKAHRGMKFTEKSRRKMSEAQKGEKSHSWKGGITPKDKKIRKGIEYRLWRESVFARDNWTCQKYGTRGRNLHPHHIKNFAQYPKLRFAIDNGITLSEKAHKEFHKKYGKKNNTKEQLKEFLSQ